MRIESSYTFTIPLRQLSVALRNPDVLAQALPGCERLTQMGPTDADGAATYEVRLRLQPETPPIQATARMTAPSEREVRVEVDGLSTDGAIHARGAMTLLAHGEGTQATYIWEEQPDGRSAEETPDEADGTAEDSMATSAGQSLARTFCARLDRLAHEPSLARQGTGPLLAETPRGRIMRQVDARGTTPARTATNRVLLVGAGAAVGLGVLVLSMRVLRRLSGGRDGGE